MRNDIGDAKFAKSITFDFATGERDSPVAATLQNLLATGSSEMFFLISQFPELNHLEPAERTTVLRKVPWWTYPAIVFGSILLALISSMLVVVILEHWLRPSEAEPLLLFGILVIAFAVLWYALAIRSIRADVRRFIAQAYAGQKPPFCFKCGYDLRSAREECCPECGQAVLTSFLKEGQ